MSILAATDFSTRSNRALRQAGLLARATGAELQIVHIVDDDVPEQLLEMDKREASRIIAEQVQTMPELAELRCHPVVVTGDPFDGILRTAATVKPDLIVMGQHRRSLLRDIFVGTTIERVVRARSFPVLMVNNEAQRRYERVLVALDMSVTSAHALLVARKVGLLETRPTLLHAFEAEAKSKMMIADARQEAVANYVSQESARARLEVISFLKLHELHDDSWPLLIEEGVARDVLLSAARAMRPDLLVMGTRGRSKLATILLGSVVEECLRSLDVDVFAVPPPW
jgi:nucleotide-binding universal stress UspA family protein